MELDVDGIEAMVLGKIREVSGGGGVVELARMTCKKAAQEQRGRDLGKA